MPEQATTDRMVGVGLLSSVVASLIVGIGARIIMRIVAMTAHLPLQFTVATLNILFLGLIFGVIAGFVYTLCIVALSSSRKVRKYLPGPLWRGLAFGVLLLMVGFPMFASSDAADLALGIPLLNKSMFGALVIIYGLTLGVAEKTFDPTCRVDQHPPGRTYRLPSAMKNSAQSKLAVPTGSGTTSQRIGNPSHDTGIPGQVCWRQVTGTGKGEWNTVTLPSSLLALRL